MSKNKPSRKFAQNKKYGGPPKKELQKRDAEFIEASITKANDRFELEELPIGIPKNLDHISHHSFTWKNSPVSIEVEAQVASLVMKKGEFGWLSESRVNEISQSISGMNISIDQSLSLRNALLQQKTVYGHYKMQSRSKAMYKLYKEGMTIIQLSKRFDFPPMNIFREILKEKGWSKNKIKESLRNPSQFSQRERNEFTEAEAADRVSNVDQSETQIRADKFEDIISDWFESRGVNLRRQEEMVAEQLAEHGRPVNTPDVLFLDHVKINDQPIAWIDAKHFYGADVNFQRKKMKKQTLRYVETWGQGAIIFRHGFSENLHLPGVILLDQGPLDLDSLHQNG